MPVPSSIGTADGFLAKTDKSKGFHYLTKGIENAEIRNKSMTMYIEDGNATFYNLKQLPDTFRSVERGGRGGKRSGARAPKGPVKIKFIDVVF